MIRVLTSAIFALFVLSGCRGNQKEVVVAPEAKLETGQWRLNATRHTPSTFKFSSEARARFQSLQNRRVIVLMSRGTNLDPQDVGHRVTMTSLFSEVRVMEVDEFPGFPFFSLQKDDELERHARSLADLLKQEGAKGTHYAIFLFSHFIDNFGVFEVRQPMMGIAWLTLRGDEVDVTGFAHLTTAPPVDWFEDEIGALQKSLLKVD